MNLKKAIQRIEYIRGMKMTLGLPDTITLTDITDILLASNCPQEKNISSLEEFEKDKLIRKVYKEWVKGSYVNHCGGVNLSVFEKEMWQAIKYYCENYL